MKHDGSSTERAAEQRSAFVLPVAAGRILSVGLWVASCVVLVSFVVLAAAHVGDRFEVGWAQGTRMALARYANEGVLFPPLYDGVHFGGTRLMPLPVLLHSGTARLTGEYLISGKIASYLSSAVMLGLLFFLLKRMGCRIEMAMALTAAVAATWAGLQTLLSIQGDTLPIVWQLGAVGLTAERPGRRSTVLAGALCVLAVLSKLSAVWAPLAIMMWLLFRRREDLAWFIGSFVLFLVVSMGALQALSGGRMFTNLYELSLAGVSGAIGIADPPIRAISMASEAGPTFHALVPFAVVGAVLSLRGRWSLYPVALGFSVLSLLVILLDEGAQSNHFLDVTVLTAVAVGPLMAAREEGATSRSVVAALVGTALVSGMLTFAVVELKPRVAGAIRTFREGPLLPNDPVSASGRLGRDDRILAEDPSVVLASGRFPPVLLDAWVLLRLEHRHPDWIRDLAARIEAGEFDLIVLNYNLDFEGWYSQIHLGRTIASAIGENYRLVEETDGYFVYEPAVAGN